MQVTPGPFPNFWGRGHGDEATFEVYSSSPLTMLVCVVPLNSGYSCKTSCSLSYTATVCWFVWTADPTFISHHYPIYSSVILRNDSMIDAQKIYKLHNTTYLPQTVIVVRKLFFLGNLSCSIVLTCVLLMQMYLQVKKNLDCY